MHSCAARWNGARSGWRWWVVLGGGWVVPPEDPHNLGIKMKDWRGFAHAAGWVGVRGGAPGNGLLDCSVCACLLGINHLYGHLFDWSPPLTTLRPPNLPRLFESRSLMDEGGDQCFWWITGTLQVIFHQRPFGPKGKRRPLFLLPCTLRSKRHVQLPPLLGFFFHPRLAALLDWFYI